MKSKFTANEIKAFFAIFIVMIFVGLLNGVPFIFGDAYGYFHVGKTLTTQGTYPTSAKPEYFDYTGHAVNFSNNKYVTPYSVGLTILQYPFLAFSSISTSGTVNTNYYKAFNGHSLYDGLAVLASAMLFAYLGILFCYLFLKEIGFTKKVSFYSTLAVALSVYLISYTFEQSGYSHVYEFFAYSAFLYYFIKFFFTKSSKYIYVASVFAGVLVLIRIVDVALVLLPFLFVLYKIRNKKVLIFTTLILGLFGCLLLAYNYVSYGSPFTLGYTTNGASGFSFGLNILNLLFSNTRGLFVWSPITIFAFIGLLMYSRKSKVSLVFFLFPVLLLLVIYNFWGNWWGGDSTGQRFLIVLAPIFALGIAYLYSQFRFKFIIKFLLFILVIFSLLTGLLFRLTPTLKVADMYRDPKQSLTTPANEDYRLTDLYIYHADLIKNSTGLSNYLSSLADSLNGGRSIVLLYLGLTDPLVKIDGITDSTFKVNFIPNNKNKDININTFITLNSSNKTKTYLIANKNYKNVSSTIITCNADLECSADNTDLLLSYADYSSQRFATIAKGLNAAVYGDNAKINFVNVKLK